MNLEFFTNAAAFRDWLQRHHATAAEIWVGFYRKDSGKTGITYAEALDEALCFGWIDGIRKKTGDDTYTNRFTRRKSGSIWSLVNVAHVARLTAAGKMHAAGLAAFAARSPEKTGVYSFERQAVAESCRRRTRGGLSATTRPGRTSLRNHPAIGGWRSITSSRRSRKPRANAGWRASWPRRRRAGGSPTEESARFVSPPRRKIPCSRG